MRDARSARLRNLLRRIAPFALLALGIAVWQVFTVVNRVPDYLLPSPSQIWRTTIDERGLLAQNTVPTLEIALGGFALALALGLVLAIAIRQSALLEAAIYPIVVASQTIPLIALAPILVVLLGFNVMPKLIVVCLVCFFPITVNAVDGLRGVDPDLVNLMRTMGAGRWRLFREVEWPAALPSIFSGVKVAATFCVIGAIWGEWVGSSEGLGYVMIQKQSQFDTAAIFSAIIILSALGIALFCAVSVTERLMLPWYHDDRRRDALLRRR